MYTQDCGKTSPSGIGLAFDAGSVPSGMNPAVLGGQSPANVGLGAPVP